VKTEGHPAYLEGGTLSLDIFVPSNRSSITNLDEDPCVEVYRQCNTLILSTIDSRM